MVNNMTTELFLQKVFFECMDRRNAMMEEEGRRRLQRSRYDVIFFCCLLAVSAALYVGAVIYVMAA